METCLSAYRFKNGKRVTQHELAKGAGVSRTFVANIESGKVSKSVINVIKIANFLDVDPRRFIILPEMFLVENFDGKGDGHHDQT